MNWYAVLDSALISPETVCRLLTVKDWEYTDSLSLSSNYRPWKMEKTKNEFTWFSLYLSYIYNIYLSIYVFRVID